MMNKWKENVFFSLVKPRERGNIGAAARAIKNMGFTNLDLVDPPANFEEGHDFWLACHAVDLLRDAEVYISLKDALKDKTLIVGASRRIGKKRGMIITLKEGVKEIMKVASKNRVAILFGREDRGLTNKEIEECGFLMTIPTAEDSPSLNLAQAVLLVAYELSCQTLEVEMPELVAYEEIRSLFEHVRRTLHLLDYIPRGNRDIEERIMRNLKHLFGRSGLTTREVRMLHGICSQVERVITRK
jgi:TrmH family RNA methyltransferase